MDTACTYSNLVDELEASDIDRKHMHVIAIRDVDLDGLPAATRNQREDLGAQLVTISGNSC
jgi:hypothetical protein